MDEERFHGFETLALHAGHTPDADTGARAVPIWQTSSYVFQDTGHAARLFALEEPGNIYTRIMNPTTDVLEKRVAALECGAAGVAFSSGMGAIAAGVMTLAAAGDEIVASTRLYGGTVTFFSNTLSRMGITVKWVDSDEPAPFAEAINGRTKVVFLETIGNPKLTIPDIAGIAQVAHERGVPVMVDNTTPSPALCRPTSSYTLWCTADQVLEWPRQLVRRDAGGWRKFDWTTAASPSSWSRPSYHACGAMGRSKPDVRRSVASRAPRHGACLSP